MPRRTLIKPKDVDPLKSPIENVLELTRLADIAPDLFTNTRDLWHPPGARGIYGGAVIAQCLSAAFMTVPAPCERNDNTVFLPHSMHCYFVLAGDPLIPIIYHVERVRDGKSYLTRTVQARQRGRCIFTTTISFMREGSGGVKSLQHGWDMPEAVREGLEEVLRREGTDYKTEEQARSLGVERAGPFISKRLGIYNEDNPHPHMRRPQQWSRCRGQISDGGGLPAHLSALAYMSDSWFIGTVARVHKLDRPRYSSDTEASKSIVESSIQKLQDTITTNGDSDPMPPTNEVGMMVSLDHTIYFHRPRDIKADEWLCSEMESPWSGDGRGLVLQRIWSKDGTLVASCMQEGLVRLKQEASSNKASRL